MNKKLKQHIFLFIIVYLIFLLFLAGGYLFAVTFNIKQNSVCWENLGTTAYKSFSPVEQGYVECCKPYYENNYRKKVCFVVKT